MSCTCGGAFSRIHNAFKNIPELIGAVRAIGVKLGALNKNNKQKSLAIVRTNRVDELWRLRAVENAKTKRFVAVLFKKHAPFERFGLLALLFAVHLHLSAINVGDTK